MADPLSIAGLALAVVSLGLQVTGGITEYFDSLKSRDQDIASIIQQNDTLRKTLRIIDSSISRFQNDHRTATEPLRQFLDSCNEELKVLESMVAALITDDQGTTGRRTKARNKGKKLLYPFHRPKLEQMATKLHHINATLQLGLQSLGLSVSHLGSEKLSTLQATSQTISSDLLVVQSEVSAISTPIQGIQSTVSQFETRFDGLENLLQQLLAQGSTINGTLQEITPAMVTERLLRKPTVLQEMCDTVKTQEGCESKEKTSVPHGNAAEETTSVPRYTRGRFSCLCGHHRHFQRQIVVWGSLNLSHETTTEQHASRCPASQAVPEVIRSEKLALTYVGLRSLLNVAVQLLFTIRSGAGGSSLSPTFTYYPIVDSKSAPAFRMISLLKRCHSERYHSGHGIKLYAKAFQEELVPSVVSSILSLYQSKQASPRAVDDFNQSLVYHVAEVIGSHYNNDILWRIRRNLDHSSPLIDLLEYLIMNKAPAMDYNTDGRTPLSILFTYGGVYGNVDHPQYAASANLILRSNNEDALAHLSSADPASPAMIVNELGQEIVAHGEAVQLYFLSHSTEIARAYGCGPLSLAILSNNLAEVKSLIANHPGALSERTLFGQTPLHLAANKASILQVLVDAADTGLLNQRDLSSRSALEVAVSLSGLKCRESSRMCKRCTCAECALVLLEADCAVVTPWGLQTLLDSASKRCKQSYVRHMKDRRDRLKQLATDSLSTMDIQHIGLDSESALDSNAFEVSLLLQANNIEIPAPLDMLGNEPFPDQGTIYQQLDLHEDADLFFRVGFRDIRSWHSEAHMEPWHTPPWPDLSYLHWLASHGGIACQLPLSSSSDIYGVRLIFATLGHYITESEKLNLSFPRAGRSGESIIGWLHEIHVAVFSAGIPDECVCLCSTRGCCLMKFLLQGLLPNFGVEPWQYQIPEPSFLRNTADLGKHAFDGNEPLERTILFEKSLLNLIHSFITYLKHFSCYLGESHHYKALRYITFTALGLPHSCCAVDHDGSKDGLEDDQWHTLALLEDLLHEFEASLTAILQDPTKGVRDIINFWQRTWAGRMSGVLCHLEGSDLPLDEKLAAEEIGVVWNRVGPEIHGSAIEYWLSELRKIEEECQ